VYRHPEWHDLAIRVIGSFSLSGFDKTQKDVWCGSPRRKHDVCTEGRT